MTNFLFINLKLFSINNINWVPAVPIGAAGEKFSKFDNFYVFSRPKFEFLSQNLDILPKNCNFKRPKSILSSTNFYWFFADFWPKNQ